MPKAMPRGHFRHIDAPPWVPPRVTELLDLRLTCADIAQHLSAEGWRCDRSDVENLKKQHGLKRTWTGTPAELDAIVRDLYDRGELSRERQGTKYATGRVNLRLAPLQIGKNRVKAALRRVDAAASRRRWEELQRTVERRPYISHYYGYNTHIDLTEKLAFGGKYSICKLRIHSSVRQHHAFRPHTAILSDLASTHPLRLTATRTGYRVSGRPSQSWPRSTTSTTSRVSEATTAACRT